MTSTSLGSETGTTLSRHSPPGQLYPQVSNHHSPAAARTRHRRLSRTTSVEIRVSGRGVTKRIAVGTAGGMTWDDPAEMRSEQFKRLGDCTADDLYGAAKLSRLPRGLAVSDECGGPISGYLPSVAISTITCVRPSQCTRRSRENGGSGY